MNTFDQFKEQAARLIQIKSDAESGNEELVRYLSSLMHDFGLKPQMQQIKHSSDDVSKRQYNLIGYTSDSLSDRTTRRGALFIGPLDEVMQNKTNQFKCKSDVNGLYGSGVTQGKVDFLCRLYAAKKIVGKRHKNPLYIAGTCASLHGMIGARYLIESLVVNPKDVVSFSQTKMKKQNTSPGQILYNVEIDTMAKDRDGRGYNRGLKVVSRANSIDYGDLVNQKSAFDHLLAFLLDATDAGFDFQWANLNIHGSEGSTSNHAETSVYLTAFQFEDFKKFVSNYLKQAQNETIFEIQFLTSNEVGVSFIPTQLIESLLELEFEWKKIISDFGQCSGALSKVLLKQNGRLSLNFDTRIKNNDLIDKIDERFKQVTKSISEKHRSFHLVLNRVYCIPGLTSPNEEMKNLFLSDAGLFQRAKFSTQIMGLGENCKNLGTAEEFVSWNEALNSIESYFEEMQSYAIK